MSQDPTISQNPDDLSRARRRSSERLRPPTEVPGYEVERFLGAGAYGEVWVAVDRNTARRVAIKFYTYRGGVDWSLLSREVEKLAFLFADRYVVQLIDVGWDADPPFYVMEFLENGSLADRIQQGPLAAAEAIALFRDVATGLTHAHDKGVLHCDLKPANVLLDQDARPRLADFGQSRLSHEQTPALGTLFYMAPEQADVNAVPDARWDVYALGALLYCMLTGEPPHRTPEAVALIEQKIGLAEKLDAYRKTIRESPRPSKHRRVPGVDGELADIIDRCLETHAGRRYPNPQAVLQALDHRAIRRARRPLLVFGAVGPALLLAVISWFAWNTYGTAVRESDAALLRRAVATNGFAAEFVAESVAGQIDRRWKMLEREADDVELRDLLARTTAIASPSADDRLPLQRWLERAVAENPDVEVSSWTLMDGRGIQVARMPPDSKTIGKNYAFRDYFSGRGQLPEGTPNIEPIRHAHLSNVFVSQATQERKVAFSVPVWSSEAETDRRRVVGVFSVTVALGRFSEFRISAESGEDQIAALVDSKPDSGERAGSLLEHPYLAKTSADPGAATEQQGIYFDEDRIRRLQRLCATAGPSIADRQETNDFDDDYRDPVGGEYAGRWLAAFRPIVVRGRGEYGRTGWVIIVQERYDAVVRPAQQLGARLVRSGLTALGIVVAVVTALWGFVIVVLNESSRFRPAALLRRLAGVSASTGLSGGGSSAESGSVGTVPGTTRQGGAAPTMTLHAGERRE